MFVGSRGIHQASANSAPAEPPILNSIAFWTAQALSLLDRLPTPPRPVDRSNGVRSLGRYLPNMPLSQLTESQLNIASLVGAEVCTIKAPRCGDWRYRQESSGRNLTVESEWGFPRA